MVNTKNAKTYVRVQELTSEIEKEVYYYKC